MTFTQNEPERATGSQPWVHTTHTHTRARPDSTPFRLSIRQMISLQYATMCVFAYVRTRLGRAEKALPTYDITHSGRLNAAKQKCETEFAGDFRFIGDTDHQNLELYRETT